MTRTPRTTTIPRSAALRLTTAAIIALCLVAVRRRLGAYRSASRVTAQRNGSGRRES